MNEKNDRVCIPDGWTQPSLSFRESKNDTKEIYRAQLSNRCKVQLSSAGEVMKIIDRILNPQREATLNFAVNEDGFWEYGDDNDPVLIPMDPNFQIEI